MAEGDKPNDKPKHPFVSGIPAVADKAEPKVFPCTGKMVVDRKVTYGS